MGRGRADPELRARARVLRLDGRSYREITATLGVPKSTLSAWLRDVPLSDEHRTRLAQRSEDGIRSRAVAIRAGRIRRTEIIHATAAAEIGDLTDRELFLLGVVAYWCEGSKAKPWSVSQRVTFINSDPGLVRLFLAWLRAIGISASDLSFRISIHERADVDRAMAFWADVVGVSAAQFQRTTLKRHQPSTNRRNTGTAYVGCLIVNVRRSTDLNRRIAGWAAGIVTASAAYHR